MHVDECTLTIPSGFRLFTIIQIRFMRSRVEKNVYVAAAGQGWFEWGPTWARHKSYASLREFQSDLGLDAGGQALDPSFADVLQLDFRLRPEIMARVKESYPQGPVPGIMLGVKH